MESTLSRISAVMIELDVKVPADAVRTELDKAYLNLGKKAHIRGFRPGKAPREILSRVYGNQVMSDVMNALVNSTLPKVLTEKNVQPITTPTDTNGKPLGATLASGSIAEVTQACIERHLLRVVLAAGASARIIEILLAIEVPSAGP